MIYSAHSLLVCFITLFSCTETVQQPAPSIVNEGGTTVQTRINVPAGYERVPAAKGSFAEYLRQLPLKPHGSNVHLFNGDLKNSNVHVAVMTVDVGKKDLQQCADAVMRLRAEYLFKQKEYGKIHFKFTNGFNATYTKWAEGYRIKVSGNTVSWYKATDASPSYESFRKYMDLVFTYAGTLSLSKELKVVAFKDLQPGDVFIRGGSPGHAVIVTDVAQDTSGKKIFMLSQSYMPAQEIHILKNLHSDELSPWYDLNSENTLYTPEWTFEKSELKRFAD
jgi:hypothetical protein